MINRRDSSVKAETGAGFAEKRWSTITAPQRGGLFDVRLNNIGHLQQGGEPTAYDRLLATRLTAFALDVLDEQFEKQRHKAFYVGRTAAGGLGAVLCGVRLDEVVGAVALVAGEALGQRVGERVDVAAGLPHLAGEDDAGVDADDVLAALDHGLPPLALDVVLQLDAVLSVVIYR